MDEPDHLHPSQILEIQSVFQIRGDIPDQTHVSALIGSQLDYEDFIDQQAQEWADRMSKTFSTKLAKSPMIAAKTLVIHLGDRAGEVARLLLEEVGEEATFEDEEDGLPF